MSRFVSIECDGVIETHAAPAVGEYATFCGLDGDDEGAGQRFNGAAPRGKVTCPDCIAMIRHAKTYKVGTPSAQEPALPPQADAVKGRGRE